MTFLRGARVPVSPGPPQRIKVAWDKCDQAYCLDCGADGLVSSFKRTGLFGKQGPRLCYLCGSASLLPYSSEEGVVAIHTPEGGKP